MSPNAASDSARNASRDTTSISRPSTLSTRTPSVVSFLYGVVSGPSGNSGVWRYGGTGVAAAGMGVGAFMGGLLFIRLSWVGSRPNNEHEKGESEDASIFA